jgi:uncharacterized protein YsxB (DUF464 family)
MAGVPTVPTVAQGLLEVFLPGRLTDRQASDSQIILRTVVQGLTDIERSYPAHIRMVSQEWRK